MAPATSPEEASEGAPAPPPPPSQRQIPGELGEAEAGGTEAPYGRQASGLRAAELSDRERRQHRDLHPRGTD